MKSPIGNAYDGVFTIWSWTRSTGLCTSGGHPQVWALHGLVYFRHINLNLELDIMKFVNAYMHVVSRVL